MLLLQGGIILAVNEGAEALMVRIETLLCPGWFGFRFAWFFQLHRLLVKLDLKLDLGRYIGHGRRRTVLLE